jgi:hypothetical protein
MGNPVWMLPVDRRVRGAAVDDDDARRVVFLRRLVQRKPVTRAAQVCLLL